MEKTICWANTDDFEQSEIVILGIPDESQSHALRKGASEAPHFIREISNLRDSYTREGKKSLGLPFNGIGRKKVLDYGNISKNQIDEVFERIISKSKIPIVMGGDHSISKDIKNVEAVYLLKAIVEQGIIGMDIMEVCPSYDIKDRTSHLASRMISEVISSCK